eukprot:13878497-Alexandrium_andersonii.AAC.1
MGASAWQRINAAHASRSNTQSFVRRLVGHYDLRWRLWLSFEQVARHCEQVGAIVMLEWPRACAYWREPRIS